VKKVLLILVLAWNISMISQDLVKNCSNSVTGKVVNKQSKASISNALIQLKLNGKIVEQIHSDVNGSFAFNWNVIPDIKSVLYLKIILRVSNWFLQLEKMQLMKFY
jgi:hypothetical protein